MNFKDFSGCPTHIKAQRLCHVTADAIFNMAALKQEVALSPVLVGLETKFKMYFGGFGRSPTQIKAQRLCHVTADAIF